MPLQHSLLIHWYFPLFLPRVPHIKPHFTERSDIAILQFLFLQYNVLAAHYQSHIYYYIHYVRIALKSVGTAIPLCCTPFGLTIYHNHWILKIKFYFAICKICTILPEEKKWQMWHMSAPQMQFQNERFCTIFFTCLAFVHLPIFLLILLTWLCGQSASLQTVDQWKKTHYQDRDRFLPTFDCLADKVCKMDSPQNRVYI